MTDAKEASFRERATELEPLPGLVDYLDEVKRRGLATALVTNAPQENVEAVLLALELGDFFDEVILSDDVGASARIATFAESDQRWLVAARMVSEGVSHKATGDSVPSTARPAMATAWAAMRVLPPPVGTRRQTAGTASPKRSL